MKKILIGALVAVVLFAAFGAAGYVYAQTITPETPNDGYGRMGGYGGNMGGRGGMMGRNNGGMMGYRNNGDGDGILHDAMVAAFAEKLGMSAADLEARLDKGETMYQVAETKGITGDEFFTMMTDVRTQALDQAVKDGTLTQEQADWMKQRGAGRGNGSRGGYDRDDCPCLENDSDD